MRGCVAGRCRGVTEMIVRRGRFKKLLRSLPSPDANGTYAGPPGTAEQARRGLMGLGRCYVGLQRYHKALELFNSACAVR